LCDEVRLSDFDVSESPDKTDVMMQNTPGENETHAAAALPSYVVAGQRIAVSRAVPGLHVVATPIGNLKDITLRALTVLAGCDAILAEDTRVTRRLLDHYGIKTRLIRHDAHVAADRIAALAGEVAAGSAYALVSDAGTPLLSDPGLSLVRAVVQAGGHVEALPGASALLTALVASAIPADRFHFEGFLPQKSGERRRRLRVLANLPGALVIYEAPHRVEECLVDLLAVMGDREAAAARELTKLHEEVKRGPLSQLAQHFAAHAPRGEFVLIVAPADGPDGQDMASVDVRLKALLTEHSVKDAAAILAGEIGMPKREAYALALKLAQATKSGEGPADG
jgi:16S rRNA (cytidine1402-2'-O)-methyltransferase